MKVSPNLIPTTIVAAALLLSRLAHAAVSLSVSPASITNDYTGVVTLTITGLTTGQQVKVKRFYDLNGNTVIDGQDMAIESGNLTDGQLPLIGGVRNANVPGDDDGTANGQIVTKLKVPALGTIVGGATGNFVFRVEDTNGNSLATQTFSVVQKVLPQGVRGQVKSSATGLPLPYTPLAIVNTGKDGNPILAVTDASGNYSFYVQPGNYTVVSTATGYVSDGNAGFESIASNQFVTNNISLATGAYTISGSITDANNGKPVGAIFLNAQDTNNLFTGGFTDTNGNYSLPVNNSQWKIDIDQGALAQKGYLAFQNKTNVTVSGASLNNVNFVLPKATALIYGTLKDSSNNPIANVQMNANDNFNLYQAVGLTSSNGSYSLGVTAGDWNAGPGSDSLSALGYTPISDTNVNLSTSQAIEADFVLSAANTHLRGQVKDNLGNPIANIQIVVQPYPVQGNGSQSIYPTTDSNGNFDAGVSGGAWNIALECVSAQNRGFVNISGYNFTVTSGVDLNGISLTFPQSTATISGTVTDTGGHPIVGVELDANQQINQNSSYFPGCVSTDNTGHYSLNVLGGTWSIAVRDSDLNALGYASISSQNVTISGGTATANFVAPLNIVPPQFATGAYSPTTGASFNITGTVGHTNTVQYSSNLVTWLTLTNAVLNNPSWHVTDPTLNQPKRFYRAFVSP